MQYKISEKRVLKKLGIEDFRHITKDKIIKFASLLPYMDPEVAKKALEQFPEFADMAGEIVRNYKDIVCKLLEEDRVGEQAFFDVCNRIIDSLQKELEDKKIDLDERNRIENKMIEVAKMIGEKDTERRGTLLKVLGIIGVIITTIIFSANSHLGVNSWFSNHSIDK